MMNDENVEVFTVCKTLHTPAPVSALAFGHAEHLFAGSDDGTLRVYDLSTFKVIKAIRGLGAEVSSIVCIKRAGFALRDAWVAHGTKISKFQLESDEMIQNLSHALVTIEVGADSATDALNEIALNSNISHLAFTFDSGAVGVIDLSNNRITKMQHRHKSICGSVKFIPDRPRELVTGGYDTFLYHFDILQRKVLSRRQMDPYIVVGGMSLSPPFVTSLAISSTGVVAAGTADGQLLIGFGAEFCLTTKKRPKKWEGLGGDETLLIKIAEGPVVALAFTHSRRLVTSTLRGVLTIYDLVFDPEEGSLTLDDVFQIESSDLEKVNALVASDKRIILAGLTKDGRGIIEVWKQESSIIPAEE